MDMYKLYHVTKYLFEMGLVSDPLVRGPGVSSPLRQSRNHLGGKAGLDFLLIYI